MGNVAKGIQLQNRAQALSLPISPTTILAAVQAAREVAGGLADRVADATGFDAVLRDVAPPPSAGELTKQLVETVQKTLGLMGISANPPIEVAVTEGGKLRVSGDHDRAAEIESVLAGDAEVTSVVERLFQTAGPTRLTVAAHSNALAGPSDALDALG